jgi:hypothetical protein
MAAIITSDFRKLNADALLSDFTANRLYIGLGRSDEWEDSVVPLPTTSDINIRDAKASLIGLKRVEDAKRVIPRVDYSITRRYKQWDPTDHLCVYPTGVNYQCYAVADGGIWLCINSPINGSNIPNSTRLTPAATTLIVTFDKITVNSVDYGVTSLDDNGYRWAFIGKIPSNSKFTSTQFVEIPASQSGTVDSTAGKIYSAKITSAGSGYSYGATTSVSIIGDGSGALATVNVGSDGKISNVLVTASGSGYTYGIIMFSPGAGSGGRIDFFPGPSGGYGKIPGREIPSWFVGLSADISGNTSPDTQIPLVPFSQLSVLRSPTVSGSDAVGTALKSFVISSTNSAFLNYPAGTILTLSSGAKVFFDYGVTESSTIRVYYHRNSSRNVNYTAFTTSHTITAINGSLLSPPVAISSVASTAEYSGDGDVLFIENFRKKTRTTVQTDQIRLIIQL